MTTTDDSMARYTKSEAATFTFIGLESPRVHRRLGSLSRAE
jgi:hypothetical protein